MSHYTPNARFTRTQPEPRYVNPERPFLAPLPSRPHPVVRRRLVGALVGIGSLVAVWWLVSLAVDGVVGL